MKILVKPSKLKGNIKAPSSKSLTQRTLIASLLSDKSNVIINPLISNDTKYLLNLFHHTYHVKENNAVLSIIPHNLSNLVYVSESAFLARVFSVISGLKGDEIVIQFDNTLKNRDLSDILILEKLGLNIKIDYENGIITKVGKLKSGVYHLDFSKSSQVLSGLLFALPLLDGDSELLVNNLVSKPYIDLTIDVLDKYSIHIDNQEFRRFVINGNQQYSKTRIEIENDWSNSAFLNIAQYFNDELIIENLNYDSRQGDKVIIDIIKHAKEDNCIDFNAVNHPDLIPVLIPFCLNLKHKSKIYGIDRLKNKESNRVEAITNEFNKLGAEIKIVDNCFVINKSTLKFAEVDSHKDHRIAMSLTIAGLLSSEGLQLNNADCVNKSYPNFYEVLQKVGALIYE